MSQMPGDANGDRCVDAADAALLIANWQRQFDAVWADGDFTGDGRVDEADATILAANWQTNSTPAASTPEPAGVVGLLVLCLAGMSGWARRKRSC